MLLSKLKPFLPSKHSAGDTIIEVLLSVTILGLVLALSFTSTGRSLNSGTNAANRNQALAYAQEQIELLRSAANNGTISNYPTDGTNFCIDPSTGAKSSPSQDGYCHLNGQDPFGVVVRFISSNQVFNVTGQWQGVNGSNQVQLYYQIPIGPITSAPNVGISISASPAVIPYNGSTTISWSTTTAQSCKASGGWNGSKPTAGSQAFNNLKTTSTYSLTCLSTDGKSSATRSVKVYVSQLPAPTVSLKATPASVSNGGSSTLSWSSTNAVSCTASGAWSGSRPLSGSQSTGALNSDQTYTLQCVNADGVSTGTDSTTVKVIPVPTINFTASPTSVSYKDSATLTWSSTNASNCVASGAWSGNKGTSGSVNTGQLTSSQTYSLRCDGAGGSSPTVSRTISVGPSGIYGYYYQGANFNYGGWGPYNDGQINWCSVSGMCENGWLSVLRARTYLSEASCVSVYWSGQILADNSGWYKMETLSDDGIRVAIDGSYVINNWTQHSATYDTGWTYMNAGWHTVQVWYQNNNGNGCWTGNDYSAAAQLIWTPPGASSRNQVPQDHLRPY